MSGGLRREWRCLSADRTVYIALALLAAAGAYGLWTGIAWSRGVQRSAVFALEKRETEFRQFRANMVAFEKAIPNAPIELELTPPPQRKLGMQPGTLAIGGWAAAISLSPLAALSVGQGDLYPAYTKVSLWNNRHDLFTEIENENPLHLLNGRFDLAFVVIYLYPLFILGLTYNLVSGEREAGTLPLLASQPVSLKTIALRRLGLLLIVLFLPIATLSAAGVVATPGALGPGGWTALGMWMLVAAAYGAFWFALALAVNSRGWNSATNAAVAATAWLALVLIVPSVLNLAVTTIAPVPSRSEYVQALREAANASDDAGQVLLARYYDEHPDLRPRADGTGPKTSIFPYWLGMWNTARQMEPVLDRYEGALARQHALAGTVRYLSPAAVALETMNDLSGTGANRYMRFRAQAAQFQREWHAFFAPRMFGGLRMTVADYDRMPRFRLPDDSVGYRLNRTLMALAGLLAPTLVMLMYSVRCLAQTAL